MLQRVGTINSVAIFYPTVFYISALSVSCFSYNTKAILKEFREKIIGAQFQEEAIRNLNENKENENASNRNF